MWDCLTPLDDAHSIEKIVEMENRDQDSKSQTAKQHK